jgi:hypothetical protein
MGIIKILCKSRGFSRQHKALLTVQPQMISLSSSVSKRRDSSTRGCRACIGNRYAPRRKADKSGLSRARGTSRSQKDGRKARFEAPVRLLLGDQPPRRPRSVRPPGPSFASAKDNTSEPRGIARRLRSSKLGARFSYLTKLKETLPRRTASFLLERTLVDLLATLSSLALRDDADETVRRRVGRQSLAQRAFPSGRCASSRQPLCAHGRVSCQNLAERARHSDAQLTCALFPYVSFGAIGEF